MSATPIHPMVPYLTGLLLGGVLKDAGPVLRAVSVDPVPPNQFRVTFASGLVLSVIVDVFLFGGETP